jgi:hypothetical protein
MNRACLLAAFVAILLSVGCGKKGAGMAGTFTSRTGVPPVEATMTFHNDGTFEGKSPAEAIKGTYKLVGRKLSMTVTEVDGKQPPPYPGAASSTATLSEDGKSISAVAAQWTKQE